MTTPKTVSSQQDSRWQLYGWRASLAVAALAVLVGEVIRWLDPDARQLALTSILSGEGADWLPFVPLVLCLPLVWSPARRAAVAVADEPAPASSPTALDWGLSLLVAAAAFGMSHAVGQSLVDDAGRPLPPAYHDEFSYLFQAETFLRGQTSAHSFQPRPELFDQMHVLNEGRFASRYFPAVGAWMAPFVAVGDPWLGHRLAAAIAAALLFWIGRDLAGRTVGLLAGLLMAISPGLALFSNLLLAHHPTLVGLLLFVWAFLRMKRRGSRTGAVLAGCGLSFAMLCRPMTAAGIGLPFGLWFAWRLLGRGVWDVDGNSNLPTVRRWQLAGWMALPLASAFGLLFAYNHSITGNALVSPYQRYTDLYTPRHVYGFNNVVRGEARLTPETIDHYDRWAENLTPSLALRNVWRRLVWSLRWTLGIVPLACAAAFLLVSRSLRGDWRLIAAAIASLHIVHIPYWFEGIMGWHYVLESAPLWLLLFAFATATAVRWSRSLGTLAPRLWWGAMMGIAILVNTVTIPLAADGDGGWLLWRSRLDRGIGEIRFPRVRYAAVRDRVDELRGERPAVVLVIPDESDRSMDYVVNSPWLDGPVLWARVSEKDQSPAGLQNIAGLFPNRMPLVLRAAAMQLEPLQ